MHAIKDGIGRRMVFTGVSAASANSPQSRPIRTARAA
jgi:hypothetical protein